MNFCILLVPLLIKRVPYGNILKQLLLLILMPQKERIYALNGTQKNLITFRRGISGKINKKNNKNFHKKRVFKKIGIFGGYSWFFQKRFFAKSPFWAPKNNKLISPPWIFRKSSFWFGSSRPSLCHMHHTQQWCNIFRAGVNWLL